MRIEIGIRSIFTAMLFDSNHPPLSCSKYKVRGKIITVNETCASASSSEPYYLQFYIYIAYFVNRLCYNYHGMSHERWWITGDVN